MRTNFLLFSIICLLAACGTNDAEERETIPADRLSAENANDPFAGLGIRYDGHYREETKGVAYLIRFFPKGNAVLINGHIDVADQLPSYLVEDALGDATIGWYNVPVTVENDSIFFKTYPQKGEISYRGNVPSTSTVRLFRHSHITGTREIKEYVFRPDGSSEQDRP